MKGKAIKGINFLRFVWRCSPRNLRPWLAGPGLGYLVRLLLLGRRPRSGPNIIVGLLSSPTGMGEGARLQFSDFTNSGETVHARDLTDRFQPEFMTITPPPAPDLPPGGGRVIVHLNPPQLPRALFALGRAALKEKMIVGYWAWELPRIPHYWHFAFHLVDEVWAPSHFVAKAICDDAPARVQVRVVPHRVRTPSIGPQTRPDFGLPSQSFVAVTVCDANSTLTRKAPDLAICAFTRAFGPESNARLIVKIRDLDTRTGPGRELSEAAAQHPNVLLWNDTWDHSKLLALIHAANCFISLHRAEGFGLVIAEAMALGTPVVATGWSGNMDFMKGPLAHPVAYSLVPARDTDGVFTQTQAHWAEPDISDAADKLSALAQKQLPSAALSKTTT